MPATSTRWVLGKDTTSLVITALSVANDGTISEGAASNLFGLLQQVEINQSADEENISPMDRPFRNPVDIELGFEMRVTELMKYTGGRLLRAIAAATRHVKVVITHAGQVGTFYAKFSENNESLAKGANTGTAVLRSFDVGPTGPANPTWV